MRHVNCDFWCARMFDGERVSRTHRFKILTYKVMYSIKYKAIKPPNQGGRQLYSAVKVVNESYDEPTT